MNWMEKKNVIKRQQTNAILNVPRYLHPVKKPIFERVQALLQKLLCLLTLHYELKLCFEICYWSDPTVCKDFCKVIFT